MGLFIVLGMVLVLGFFAAYVGVYYDCDILDTIGWISSIASSVGFVIALLFLPTLQSEFDNTKEQYYNLKAQVEYVESDIVLNDANLRNQVLEMNNKISTHKVYSRNWWVGVYYSKEIGNLPKLQWKNEFNVQK